MDRNFITGQNPVLRSDIDSILKVTLNQLTVFVQSRRWKTKERRKRELEGRQATDDGRFVRGAELMTSTVTNDDKELLATGTRRKIGRAQEKEGERRTGEQEENEDPIKRRVLLRWLSSGQHLRAATAVVHSPLSASD